MKKSWCRVAMEKHMMEQVHGILVMTLLGMLLFLVLIIVHHLMLTITKKIFAVLCEGQAHGVNGSFGVPQTSLVLILIKQTRNFA